MAIEERQTESTPQRGLMTRRWLLGRSLVALSGAVALSGCTVLNGPPATGAATAPAGGAATATPRVGGTLRIAKPEDVVRAGVPFLLTPANLQLFSLVYDTLVSYDTQFTPRPRLATSWEWSPDARKLTVKLRSGVKFHTGRPFTSADAKFNLERLLEPAIGSPWRGYVMRMQISTPDAATVVVDYDAPIKSSFDVLTGSLMADP